VTTSGRQSVRSLVVNWLIFILVASPTTPSLRLAAAAAAAITINPDLIFADLRAGRMHVKEAEAVQRPCSVAAASPTTLPGDAQLTRLPPPRVARHSSIVGLLDGTREIVRRKCADGRRQRPKRESSLTYLCVITSVTLIDQLAGLLRPRPTARSVAGRPAAALV